jgi:serine/threonine protein kinase
VSQTVVIKGLQELAKILNKSDARLEACEAKIQMWQSSNFEGRLEAVDRRLGAFHERLDAAEGHNKSSATSLDTRVQDLEKKTGFLQKYQQIALASIDIGARLGKGAHGEVNKGEWRQPEESREVAVKIFDFEDRDSMNAVNKELAALSKMPRHDNVVAFYGAAYDQVQMRLLVVMEFCQLGGLNRVLDIFNPDKKGSPARLLEAIGFEPGANVESVQTKLAEILGGRLPGAEGAFFHIAKGIAKGVAHLHDHKIAHGDLKPENILLDSQGKVRVADFSVARIMRTQNGRNGSSVKGTIGYIAPELMQGEGKEAGPESDMFSLAMLYYELLTGCGPFQNYNNDAAIIDFLVVKGGRPTFPASSDAKTQQLAELITRMWAKETYPYHKPSSRPSAKNVLEDVQKVFSEIDIGPDGVSVDVRALVNDTAPGQRHRDLDVETNITSGKTVKLPNEDTPENAHSRPKGLLGAVLLAVLCYILAAIILVPLALTGVVKIGPGESSLGERSLPFLCVCAFYRSLLFMPLLNARRPRRTPDYKCHRFPSADSVAYHFYHGISDRYSKSRAHCVAEFSAYNIADPRAHRVAEPSAHRVAELNAREISDRYSKSRAHCITEFSTYNIADPAAHRVAELSAREISNRVSEPCRTVLG